jgi:two-component system, chemotaxis family, sensor kinase CheA
MAQDPYRYFRLEARELQGQLGQGVLELEKSEGAPDLIQRLLRLSHTLKGAARVVKQAEIADRAHAIEDVLSPYRGGGVVPRGRIDLILEHLDEIGGHIGALGAAGGGEVAAPAPDGAAIPATAAPDDEFRTIRADMAEMDVLLDGVAESHAGLAALRKAMGGMTQARNLAELIAEQLARRGRQRAADPAQAMAEELRQGFDRLARNLAGGIDRVDRELRQLHDSAAQLRLVPAELLFAPLERTARDAAHALGRQVDLVRQGGDIRLDAPVLGAVRAALVQIVRNAVAHGIESESERRAAGKPAAGRITVAVSRRGAKAVFECADDGRGVDLEAVRRVAARRGLHSAATQELDAEALFRLLLRGGISTSGAVTELSGRGVGLDIVRAAIAGLNGEVVLRSEPGRGTRFELVVPLSLASVEALIVEAPGQAAAIPLDSVKSALRIAERDLSQSADGDTVLFDGKSIPFLPLSRALRGGVSPGARSWSTIVIAGAEGAVAIGVDRLLGTARIVMRPLPASAPPSATIAGAWLDAEGNPQLVLDPEGVVARARRVEIAAAPATMQRRPILVIDDSLTTRMLEQSILEAAGYRVEVAASAEEGLARAQRTRYGLFLVDVEMPGMDGFAFVERTRSDPALHDIPAILVTSRSSPEDRQRGRDAGARGYVVKSEFDQSALLAMIAPMAG